MRGIVSPADLVPVGQHLSRPECVVALADGRIICSDARGGITAIRPDGSQAFIGPQANLVPNGLAALADGTILVANVGHEGGLWQCDPSGRFSKVDIRFSGQPLPEVNFVHVDAVGRVWLAISSSGVGDPVFSPEANEGVIVVGDAAGFRVVASGLGWTNELRLNAACDRLYVNETFGRRLLTYKVAADGQLSDRTVMAEFGAGDFPDGMAIDEENGVWVVSFISNRVYRVTETGCSLVFSDEKPDVVDHVERLYTGPGMRRADLRGLETGTRVNNLSSLAFGGPDRRTVYLGSLNGTCLWSFRSPVAGRVEPLQRIVSAPASLRAAADLS